MFTHFTSLVNSTAPNEDLAFSTSLSEAKEHEIHDAALLADAGMKFSLKVLPTIRKGPACTFRLVGLNGWYPPNWPSERRIAASDLNFIIASFEQVATAAAEGRIRPKYLQDDIWQPSDCPSPVNHTAFVLLGSNLDDLLTSMSYTCGSKPCLANCRKNFHEYFCPHGRESRAGVDCKTERKLENRSKCTGC